MALRGTRFNIDLDGGTDEGDISKEGQEQEPISPVQNHEPSNVSLVKDILEHPPSEVKSPIAPTLKSTATGFPVHKKRIGVSKFKASRDFVGEVQQNDDVSPTSASKSSHHDLAEKQRIDLENRERLAAMSDDEISREREELLSTLSPAFLEKLLKRSTIDDTSCEDTRQDLATTNEKEDTELQSGAEPQFSTRRSAEPSKASSRASSKGVVFADPQPTGQALEGIDGDRNFHDEDYAAPESFPSQPLPSNYRFPKPGPLPSLDPSDPDFLDQLHEKYFPDLPADPSKLSWMTSPASDPSGSVYSPSQRDISVSDLRFSFSGEILGPKTALKIPVTAGLHHHGDAPSSAGYTVGELAHLSRSSYPAQRCVAYQILGRLLYRLGKGQFGNEESDLASGLWECVRQGRVIETLEDEGAREGARVHLSAKAYATEALWLWRRGGGRRWDAK